MKWLSTLIKLQKNRVDEQRQILARLQQRLDDVNENILMHEKRKELERGAVKSNPEISLTYGAFLRWAVEYSRELEREREIAEKAVEAARDRMAELFEEQKRYEIAEARRLEKEKQEEQKRETIELDEIGSITHQRKKSGK